MLKLEVQRSRLDKKKNFFSQRVFQKWNSLPQQIIESASVNLIKKRFDNYQDMDIKCNAYSAHHYFKFKFKPIQRQTSHCDVCSPMTFGENRKLVYDKELAFSRIVCTL